MSTRPFPVAHGQYEFSEKQYMCLLRALWMTAVALEHAQRVSRQLHSLIRHRLPLWRIQRVLCIESVNSLVCHVMPGDWGAPFWRRHTKSCTYPCISPGKRVAWSSKQPKVLHITSYFLAIMPPKKRQKQTLMSAFTRYRYIGIIDSWSLVTRFYICRLGCGRVASHLTDVWSLFLARDRQIGVACAGQKHSVLIMAPIASVGGSPSVARPNGRLQQPPKYAGEINSLTPVTYLWCYYCNDSKLILKEQKIFWELTDDEYPVKSPTKILPGGRKKKSHQSGKLPTKICEVGFFPSKIFYQIYPWLYIYIWDVFLLVLIDFIITGHHYAIISLVQNQIW